MKSVKAAKFGHSVTLCGGEHTFITKSMSKYKDYKMLWDGENGCLVIEAKYREKVDRAVVPMGNIAQMVFDERNSESDSSGAVPTKPATGRAKKAS